MLARWGIRLATSLAGIALGLVLSAAFLGGFSIDLTSLITATLLFWVVHIVVQFISLRVLVRQPSVAMAGLLALASTVIALVTVAIVIDGVNIHGVEAYVLATLIIWICTVLGDLVGARMIRARRQERRA